MEGCNTNMYRDQFGVCHLVLAKENTEAGDYYNPSTIGFLKNKIKTSECKNTLNLVDSFQKFCNNHLEKMIGQKIQLTFDENTSAFLNKDGTDIKIDGIAWTSLGEVVTSDFKPKYSILERKLDNGDQELVVEIESIDCERVKETQQNKSYMTAKIDNKDGYHCLKLKGQKIIDKGVPDAKDPTKTSLINYSRGEGYFDMTINLVKNKFLKNKKIHEPSNGITKFTFVFSENGGDDDF
jgi:flagellar hook protein FlgE